MANHETPAIAVKPVLATLLVVVVVLTIAMTALYIFYESYPESAPPKAQLTQNSPNAAALDRKQDDEREHLERYGWISRDEQVIHIPIDQAMKLVVQQSMNYRGTAPDSGDQR